MQHWKFNIVLLSAAVLSATVATQALGQAKLRLIDQAVYCSSGGRGWYPMAISSDGSHLATACVSDTDRTASISIWDLADLSEPLRVIEAGNGIVQCVAISKDDTLLAAGTAHGECKVWDLSTGTLVSCYTAKKNGQIVDRRANSSATSIAFLNDGKTILAAYNSLARSNAIKAWAIDGAAELKELPLAGLPTDMSCSPTTDLLAVGVRTRRHGGNHGEVQLWRVTDAKRIRQLRGYAYAPPLPVAISQNGRILATGDGNAVVLWNLDKEQSAPITLHRTNLAAGPVTKLAFSGDARFLAVARLNSPYVGVYDLHSMQLAFVAYHADPVSSKNLLFKDDETLVTMGFQQIRIWGLPQKSLRNSDSHQRGSSLASPDR